MHNKLSLLHLNGIHESPHTANVKAQKNWWGPFLPDFWATTSSSPRELYPLRGHSPTWWRAQPLEQSFPMSWQLQTQVSAGSMGLSAVGWADVPLPKREINQPLPGSTNGHDGKMEGKAKGEKVHLSIKQVCPHSGTEGKFSQTSVHPVVNSAWYQDGEGPSRKLLMLTCNVSNGQSRPK